MAASQALIADDVLDAYPIASHRSLLDVGGGDGTFLIAAARRAPDLRLTLFDLPAVAARATARLAAAGLAGRSRAVGGSFHADPLPDGADVVTLIRVLLDHDDATALRILGAARRALPSGGRLLVAETLAGAPEADAYFGFYLLAMGRGRARSFAELARLVRMAGFGDVRQLRTFRPTLTSLISARATGTAVTEV
jgi:demethylspheroidene O-methyltransferase